VPAFQVPGFPAIYVACATGFAWIRSWHGAQTVSVLRRFLAMMAAHAGWSGPGFPSSLSLATWWTITVVSVSQSSHSRWRSRASSSLRGTRTRTGAGSVMTARWSCRRVIPPNRATRSGLSLRLRLAWKQVLGPSPVVTFALMAGGHRGDGGLVLEGQRLEHRCLGVPAQRAQPPGVLGEQGVVHDAAIVGSVDPHDVVVVQVLDPRPVPRLAVFPGAGALGPDHVRRHCQRDLAVGRSAAVADFRAGVLDDDVIAVEPRPLAAGVRDQGFGRVQFQSEGLP
jgi:hypothetical protein